MQKDLKIGLVLGLVLAASAVLWVATRPSLSPRARMSRISNATDAQESFGSPNNLSANEANTADNQPPIISPQPELPDSSQYEQTKKIKTQKFHIVLKGQTLSMISQKYYGSAGKWQKIFDANKRTIKDPNKLRLGTKLIIPD